MITLVNRFEVHGDPAEFERIFADTAAFMRARPGFVGSHLVRSTGDPKRYFNVAQWASRADLERAATSEEMAAHREEIRRYATPDPHPCTTVCKF